MLGMFARNDSSTPLLVEMANEIGISKGSSVIWNRYLVRFGQPLRMVTQI